MSGFLHIRDLTVSLGGKPVVEVSDLSLPKVGWVGLVGANGSGKTTLLRAICGRLPLASGEIVLDGAPCGSDRSWRAAHIGFAPEIFSLPGELTGLDVLSLVVRSTGHHLGDPLLASLRDALGVSGFWHRRIETYSAGMRQRLAIFAAFAGGQRIVVLDEPFNWLDPVSSFDVKNAVAELARGTHLVLSALHDLSTLLRHCQEGYLLADGRVRMAISAEMITEGMADIASFERAMIDRLRSHSWASIEGG